MEIGERIKSLREFKKLTQEQVGHAIGVNKATVNRYETGVIDIKRTVAIKLAEVLETSPSYLMGWEDYPFQLKEMAEKEIEKRGTMVPIEALNIRLEKALENKKMKILELSQRTNISENTLRGYLSGCMRPSTDNIYLISRELEISQDWLMGYDVPMEAKCYSRNYELSAEEECIITIFRSLNKAAQDRLVEYSMELNEISKYHLKK